METADVVVIGGGANGASTAFSLASLGVRRVILLERSALGAG
ncbi:MAG TPA: FAD-dependent oxidoreductase, partial [Methylomirabilota bacterium]|nr:FAD-dependent oxidoreductase [Methylomirabilota bacterium]